ncbi:MAG: hypothetical protein LBL75_04240 [Rickettsiales bacterium]|jgi:hypothetical protein|nr:hypothetical protein [Rickettsiales bacterium]
MRPFILSKQEFGCLATWFLNRKKRALRAEYPNRQSKVLRQRIMAQEHKNISISLRNLVDQCVYKDENGIMSLDLDESQKLFERIEIGQKLQLRHIEHRQKFSQNVARKYGKQNGE